MRTAWVGLLCCLVMGTAWAGNERAVKRQIEASMQITGSLDVDETGCVRSHAVDRAESLPSGVVQLLDQILPTFRFQPVLHDGHPGAVHAKMSLVVAANQVDREHVAIRIRSARFDESDPPPGELITIDHRVAMHYPVDAMSAGVAGTVYVAVRIDRSGHVVDAQAQQVNLRFIDNERGMQRWREALSKPTLATVRRYTFHVPTSGKHAGDEYFSGILPVIYRFEGDSLPTYGTWQSYVPGPRQDIAWLDQEQADAGSNEAIPEGTFAQAGTGMTLLTPLDGG